MNASFIKYTPLAPSYIKILNVYAVRFIYTSSLFPGSLALADWPHRTQLANVHDVSWGTKSDNKVSTDLGVVKASKRGTRRKWRCRLRRRTSTQCTRTRYTCCRPIRRRRKRWRGDEARGLFRTKHLVFSALCTLRVFHIGSLSEAVESFTTTRRHSSGCEQVTGICTRMLVHPTH
ncbi:hypothetical protein EDB84DRAFT_345355 [Lactarius hengduanensis]|nr:hypothetical protein EDB84DRAFT_345355 [Lactarius hengduanensis]